MVTKIYNVLYVVSYALRERHRSLSKVTWQMSDAIHGTLSMFLVNPPDLFKLLVQIQRHLEDGVSLPFPLTGSKIYKYYEYLQPLMLPDGERFHVVIIVPLIHTHSKLKMYRVVSVPIPN